MASSDAQSEWEEVVAYRAVLVPVILLRQKNGCETADPFCARGDQVPDHLYPRPDRVRQYYQEPTKRPMATVEHPSPPAKRRRPMPSVGDFPELLSSDYAAMPLYELRPPSPPTKFKPGKHTPDPSACADTAVGSILPESNPSLSGKAFTDSAPSVLSLDLSAPTSFHFISTKDAASRKKPKAHVMHDYIRKRRSGLSRLSQQKDSAVSSGRLLPTSHDTDDAAAEQCELVESGSSPVDTSRSTSIYAPTSRMDSPVCSSTGNGEVTLEGAGSTTRSIQPQLCAVDVVQTGRRATSLEHLASQSQFEPRQLRLPTPQMLPATWVEPLGSEASTKRAMSIQDVHNPTLPESSRADIPDTLDPRKSPLDVLEGTRGQILGHVTSPSAPRVDDRLKDPRAANLENLDNHSLPRSSATETQEHVFPPSADYADPYLLRSPHQSSPRADGTHDDRTPQGEFNRLQPDDSDAQVTGPFQTDKQYAAGKNDFKQKRLYSSRKKTHCLTCRRRRRKCDEIRPVCGGCLRSKLICEGFSSEGKPSKNRAVPLQPLIYQALTEKTQSTLYEIYHFIDGDPPYQFPRVKMGDILRILEQSQDFQLCHSEWRVARSQPKPLSGKRYYFYDDLLRRMFSRSQQEIWTVQEICGHMAAYIHLLNPSDRSKLNWQEHLPQHLRRLECVGKLPDRWQLRPGVYSNHPEASVGLRLEAVPHGEDPHKTEVEPNQNDDSVEEQGFHSERASEYAQLETLVPSNSCKDLESLIDASVVVEAQGRSTETLMAGNGVEARKRFLRSRPAPPRTAYDASGSAIKPFAPSSSTNSEHAWQEVPTGDRAGPLIDSQPPTPRHAPSQKTPVCSHCDQDHEDDIDLDVAHAAVQKLPADIRCEDAAEVCPIIWEAIKYAATPQKRRNVQACKPGCSCSDSKDCKCAGQCHTCGPLCGCPPSCRRRSGKCDCRNGCKGPECLCQRYNRECDKSCGCLHCHNNQIAVARWPRVVVGPSTIPSAGEGLFADEDIMDQKTLGIYKGVVRRISRVEKPKNAGKLRKSNSSTSPNRVSSGEPIRLLDNSKDTCIDPATRGNSLSKINHSRAKQNVRFALINSRGKVYAVVAAIRDIKKGEELFVIYGSRRKFEEFDKNIPQNILLNRTSVDDDNPFTLQKVKGKGHRRKIAETKWNADVRISPEKLWQECHQEDNLYVRDERIERYGFIHVLGEEPDSDAKHPESAESDPDYFEDPQNAELSRYVLRENRAIWVAHVLDIRTFIGQFWLHVIWMYRPEELPSGRQPHHGKWELIASTHEGIISSESIISAAKVTRFNEGGGELPLEQWYWRQLYNASTRRLSRLRKYCICNGYANPDQPLLHCPKCDIWLHLCCVIEADFYTRCSRYTEDKPREGNTRLGARSSCWKCLSCHERVQ